VRRFYFASLGLVLVLMATFDGGGVSGAAGIHDTSSGGLHRTLRAVSLHEESVASIPNYQSAGTLVPKVDIAATAGDSNGARFGLAVYPDLNSATYPAISIDGGATWRICGPRFWVAAAQGPAVTSSVGALNSRGAYFWGQDGNLVKVTLDEGVHWWATGFPGGVYKVSATHGTLRTVALGNQVKGGAFQDFLYISTDSGRTWKFHGRLPDLKL
jgi:hypothetical protein